MSDKIKVVSVLYNGATVLAIGSTETIEDKDTREVVLVDEIFNNPESLNIDKAIEVNKSDVTDATAHDVESYLSSKGIATTFENDDYVVFPLKSLGFERCLGRVVGSENSLYSVNVLLPRLDGKTNVSRFPFQLEKVSEDDATMMFLTF